MVATGIGLTVLPASSLSAPGQANELLAYVPFKKPIPNRRIALVWRKSFPRISAIDALTRGIMESGLGGVNYLKVEYNSNFPYPELA